MNPRPSARAPKRVLFLSGLDFKEKSIQVIRKTPEAYRDAGWEVDYLVARDGSMSGGYAYERVFSPEGISTQRFAMPLSGLRRRARGAIGLALATKAAHLLAALSLALRARRALSRRRYDLIYGYEVIGANAAFFLRCIHPGARKACLVTRFQGTFLGQYIEDRDVKRLFFNLDHAFAMYCRSDLLVMTNDGTGGDRALAALGSRNRKNVLFLVNGVDGEAGHGRKAEGAGVRGDRPIRLLCLSRLESWKRVDRAIELLRALKDRSGAGSFFLEIVGEGSDRNRLEARAHELGLADDIDFAGAIDHGAVRARYDGADFFLSFYDSSNVGNPLLEALRFGTIPVTLANGDTGSWIRHGHNGLIYDPKSDFIGAAAQDIIQLAGDVPAREAMEANIAAFAKDRLWTWKERMGREIAAVETAVAAKRRSIDGR